LRRLKGVNIGGYDGELCVRKIRSIKSSVEPICGCHRTLAYIRDTFIHTAAHTRLTRLDALQIVDSHIYILITRLFHFLAVRTCYACVGKQPLFFLLFFHLLLVIISIFWQSYTLNIISLILKLLISIFYMLLILLLNVIIFLISSNSVR